MDWLIYLDDISVNGQRVSHLGSSYDWTYRLEQRRYH